MEKDKERQNIEEEKSDEKFDDSESIPLADDDPSAIIDDESSRYIAINKLISSGNKFNDNSFDYILFS